MIFKEGLLIHMRFTLQRVLSLILITFLFISCKESEKYNKFIKEIDAMPKSSNKAKAKGDEKSAYQQYMDYFEEVYATVQENYYKDIDRDDFDRFVKQFDTKIYNKLKDSGKSDDFIRWRSAAFLVEYLRDDEDIFSALFPPEPAKEYAETALGVRIDLGIQGELVSLGYQATQVEPRSDAYIKGLREGDILTKVDDSVLLGLDEKAIAELLRPLIGTMVRIKYIQGSTMAEKDIEVKCDEYFRQTVFMKPTKIPYIYCLEIRKFNRKTSDDLLRYMMFFKQQGPIRGLILDLRGNPGGPPLAAREISSFFLPGGDDFSYFQKKGSPKMLLDVPTIPDEYKYNGPMVILIDKESGSSSELFSGIMQKRGRAVLMGKNSAGQVMLKSMFHLSDNSMVLLVTGRGHHPDGTYFSFDGLTPDKVIEDDEDIDIVDYASTYFVYMSMQK